MFGMAIVFFRVDERIIHGQVITRWLSEVDAQGIVAIDDQAANDPIISKVLKGAVPHGLKGFVMPVERVAKRWDDIVGSDKKYMVVAKTPATFKRLIEAGVDMSAAFPKINVGPMSEKAGTKSVGPGASVTAADMESFTFLSQHGMEIYFQLVPDSKKTSWAEAQKVFG
jgi:PTS system mannose-specific IIB component